MTDNLPWTLKYAPKRVEDMVLTKELSELFKKIIETKTLTNISLFGSPGIGKTTLAKILVEELGCDYHFQPCSVDGSIDMVKTTIKNFTEIIPKGKYKVVILDEADQLSEMAQKALRDIVMESMDNCRFILTANYQDKIIPALKSRCTPIKLEFTTNDVLVYCVEILKKEKISLDKASVTWFYENVIKKNRDIRSIIENLQLMSLSGTLKEFKSNEAEIKNDIVRYIHDGLKTMKIRDIREHLIMNEDKFSSDYVKLAQELFDAFDNNVEAMAIIADALWRMSFQLDKEIQFTGMLISLQKACK